MKSVMIFTAGVLPLIASSVVSAAAIPRSAIIESCGEQAVLDPKAGEDCIHKLLEDGDEDQEWNSPLSYEEWEEDEDDEKFYYDDDYYVDDSKTTSSNSNPYSSSSSSSSSHYLNIPAGLKNTKLPEGVPFADNAPSKKPSEVKTLGDMEEWINFMMDRYSSSNLE